MPSRSKFALAGALLALSVLSQGRSAHAQESELASLRTAPTTDPAAQLRLGRALRRAGRFDEALRALRIASRGPTRADALHEVARVRFDQGDFRAARTACNALAAGLPRRVCLARAHLVWQRVALAEREITAARAIEPNHPELLLVIADAHRVGGRLQEAEQAYRAAESALGSRPDAHLGVGRLFEGSGRLEEARAAFQRAVDADPKDPLPALALGRVLQRLGRIEQALPLLQRANADRPDWAEALVAIGGARLGQSALEEAQQAFARAITLNASQPGAQSGLGRVHLRAGRLTEAEGPLRAAIEQVPNDAEARTALAELLGRTERGDDAIAEWNRVIDLLPADPAPRMRAAAQARAMRLNTLARAYLDRVLSDEPQHASALLMRADIAFDDNDRRAARQLYQQALAGRGEIDRARAQARIQEIDAPPRTRRR
jgi:tetratricopeptide (TPR) repeat protein